MSMSPSSSPHRHGRAFRAAPLPLVVTAWLLWGCAHTPDRISAIDYTVTRTNAERRHPRPDGCGPKYFDTTDLTSSGYEKLATVTLVTTDFLEGETSVNAFAGRWFVVYAAALKFVCPLGGTAWTPGQSRIGMKRQEFDFAVWDAARAPSATPVAASGGGGPDAGVEPSQPVPSP